MNEDLLKENDFNLVQNIKNNNQKADDSIKILSFRHTGLFNNILSKYVSKEDENLKNDLINEKLYIVFNSAKNYNSDKGSSFPTFFANETKWNCLKKKNTKFKKEISCEDSIIESIQNKNNNFKESLNDSEVFKLINIKKYIDSIGDEKAKKIINMRYFSNDNKNIPWKKISDEVKLSIQGCINIHNKYIKNIKKQILKNKEI